MKHLPVVVDDHEIEVPPSAGPLLQVDGVTIRTSGHHSYVLVDDVSFTLEVGETLAIVGESGSGKTLMTQGLLGLLPHGLEVSRGSARFDDVDLVGAPRSTLDRVRGARIGIVFQDAAAALTPHTKIGKQLDEVLRAHSQLSRSERMRETLRLLGEVGLPDPQRAAASYPFELSGGMRQRALIAIALAASPELLIADEPTTALDVTVQAQVLELVISLRRSHRLSVMWVTHDLAIASSLADRIMVMYAGGVVELGETVEIIERPAHPYTAALLRSAVDLSDGRPRATGIPGSLPDPKTELAGCRFAARCEARTARCVTERPELASHSSGHRVACWNPVTVASL